MSPQRDYFYPNTETLGAGEMRVTALGTGRPFVRRGQAIVLDVIIVAMARADQEDVRY